MSTFLHYLGIMILVVFTVGFWGVLIHGFVGVIKDMRSRPE
jgi:hypothetical protein